MNTFLIIQNQKTRFSCLRELLWPVRLQARLLSWRNPGVLIVILDCCDFCVKCNLLQRCLLAIWKEQGKYIKQHLMFLHNCSSSPSCKCFIRLLLHVCFLGWAAFISACLRFLYTVVRRHLNIFCKMYEQEGKPNSQKHALTLLQKLPSLFDV